MSVYDILFLPEKKSRGQSCEKEAVASVRLEPVMSETAAGL